MISVVIPMYNSRNTIGRCIQSLLNQTFSDFEVIVINDGSTDDSQKLVEELAGNDRRIHCINQTNGGVSNARNHGILASKGEYICFVDSDDAVSKDYLSCLMDSMNNTKSDLAICGYSLVTDKVKEQIVLDPDQHKKLNGKLTDDLFILKDFVNAPFMKLFRTEKIKNNHILFPEKMAMAEDQYFNYCYYSVCDTVSFVNLPNYFYYRLDSGLSSKRTKQSYQNEIDNLRHKAHVIQQKSIMNGDCIIAEDICNIARYYISLSDDDNSLLQASKRVNALAGFCPKIRLEDQNNHLLFQLIKHRLGILYVLYYQYRHWKK